MGRSEVSTSVVKYSEMEWRS